jgi:hypothetical protein
MKKEIMFTDLVNTASRALGSAEDEAHAVSQFITKQEDCMYKVVIKVRTLFSAGCTDDAMQPLASSLLPPPWF